MAKIKTKNGKIATCSILNESLDSYVVEYNGKVGRVKKSRVIELDAIDEGLLRTIKDRAKGLLKKVLNKFIQTIYTGEELQAFIRTPDAKNDGKPADYMPMGLAILARKATSVYWCNLCNATKRYAAEIGLMGRNVPVTESVLSEAGVAAPYVGVAKMDASNSQRINLDAIGNYDPVLAGKAPSDEDVYAFDIDQEGAIDMIVWLYYMKATHPNWRPKYAPIILGAPGNAKSALVNTALDIIRDKLGFKNAEAISIILSGGAEGLLYMPSSVTHKFRSRDNREFEDERWAQKPMLGIPAFQATGDPDLDRVYEDNANGLIVDDSGKVRKEAEGGIFIIDEATRSDERSMKEIMNILSGNPFGTNLYMGNRWVCILAGNRKKDMENLAGSQDFALDSAQRTRLAIYNMVLSADEWIDWAQKPSKELDGAMPNVLPEIVAYVASKAGNSGLYSVQISDTNPSEYVNVWQDAANGRSWEGVSNELLTVMNYYDPTFTKVNTIRDLRNMDPRIDDKWLTTRVAAHVGMPIAQDFVKFLRTLDFDRTAAQEVYNTGTCKVKTATPAFMIPIVQRIANCNPNFLANNNAAPEDLFPPKNLMNVLNYIRSLCKTLGGSGSAASTAVSSLRRYWTVLDDYCAALYPSFGGKSMIELFTTDEGNGKYGVVPGYEQFITDFYKYIDQNKDYLEARQKKGLA